MSRETSGGLKAPVNFALVFLIRQVEVNYGNLTNDILYYLSGCDFSTEIYPSMLNGISRLAIRLLQLCALFSP